MANDNMAGSNRELVDRTLPGARTAGESIGLGGAVVDRHGGRIRLRMWGDHDMSNVGLLHTALAEAMATDDPEVVVDLTEVVFMDGSTVGALAHGCALLAARGRRLTLRSPSQSSRSLLEVCDLANLIEPLLIERLRTAEPPKERGASTALETWIEVPKTPRPASSAPPQEVDVASVEAERARR